MYTIGLLCCEGTLLTHILIIDGSQVTHVKFSLGKSTLIPSLILLSFMYMDMASSKKYRYPDETEDIKVTEDYSRKE